ncbi:MAG: acylphosphatase, partial [Flavobacteriaceae bacterium]|nr:acylphosphatase [Flavobacteriaceae bacterium]
MKTFHIIIKGIVQGVGFRPFVYKLAKSLQLKGWINNTVNGVHIHVNTNEEMSLHFIKELESKSPKLSVITSIEIHEIPFISYSNFEIKESSNQTSPSLLITPDFGMCKDCNEELFSEENDRYQYPFITCTNCGPRYSIINSLPYDRETTTMDSFCMCKHCNNEYHDPINRRYYSQTNSCPNCRIELSYFENGKLQENFTDLDYIAEQWRQGNIVSIKGIGGYLITCDASNKEAVSRLRILKNRPTKPFALMYPNISS